VAIVLKLSSFDPAHKGQIEPHLRWLDRYERRPGEEPPIGLILCGEKNHDQIELLQIDRGEIRVAEYLVELPPREMRNGLLLCLFVSYTRRSNLNGCRFLPEIKDFMLQVVDLSQLR